tara:strand:+ start:60 stop:278 length:219 start_codon:yes stop_codon:yes gene_type:complete
MNLNQTKNNPNQKDLLISITLVAIMLQRQMMKMKREIITPPLLMKYRSNITIPIKTKQKSKQVNNSNKEVQK